MLAVASTLSQQAWACGCLPKEELRSVKAFVLPHQIVGFQHGATAIGRGSSTRAGTGCQPVYAHRNFQRIASRQSPSDSGTDMEDDGEEGEADEEEASAGQVFEENMEIMMGAAINLFRKYSARAVRAIREILPPAISTELIAFGVKGAICLSVLWVLKAVLEVVCSIATYVYAGLLVMRLAWSLVVSAQPGGDATWFPEGN